MIFINIKIYIIFNIKNLYEPFKEFKTNKFNKIYKKSFIYFPEDIKDIFNKKINRIC